MSNFFGGQFFGGGFFGAVGVAAAIPSPQGGGMGRRKIRTLIDWDSIFPDEYTPPPVQPPVQKKAIYKLIERKAEPIVVDGNAILIRPKAKPYQDSEDDEWLILH